MKFLNLQCSALLQLSAFETVVVHHKAASVIKWTEFLATDPEVRVRFRALPDFLRSSGSGTGSTQPREYNGGAA
jgi:hypothetical protein